MTIQINPQINAQQLQQTTTTTTGGGGGGGSATTTTTTTASIATTTDTQQQQQLDLQDPNEMLLTMQSSASLEEYYPALAIHLLMRIIKTSIGISSRKDAIQSLVYAMRILDTRSVNYVELVIPPFLKLIKNTNDNLVTDLITQMCHLVTYMKKHIEPYLPDILNVIEFYWNNTEKQAILIALIELLEKYS